MKYFFALDVQHRYMCVLPPNGRAGGGDARYKKCNLARNIKYVCARCGAVAHTLFPDFTLLPPLSSHLVSYFRWFSRRLDPTHKRVSCQTRARIFRPVLIFGESFLMLFFPLQFFTLSKHLPSHFGGENTRDMLVVLRLRSASSFVYWNSNESYIIRHRILIIPCGQGGKATKSQSAAL